MADAQQGNENQIVVPKLKGLNERAKYTGGELEQFDVLEGFIQQKDGCLQRINGAQLYQRILGKQILNIHPTYDDRQNILIQTDQGVYLYTEREFFNRAGSAVLVPVTFPEEETMSQAIFKHVVGSGVNGGGYTTGNVWQQMPLNTMDQRNPDGSAATFVTAFGGVGPFTLAAGIYRIEGWAVMSNNTGSLPVKCRLFNITGGAIAVWEDGTSAESVAVETVATSNMLLPLIGSLNLAVPTQFELQGLGSTAQANTGMGRPKSAGGFTIVNELYRLLKVLKTG